MLQAAFWTFVIDKATQTRCAGCLEIVKQKHRLQQVRCHWDDGVNCLFDRSNQEMLHSPSVIEGDIVNNIIA